MQTARELVQYRLNVVGIQVRCYAVGELLNQQGMILFCVE